MQHRIFNRKFALSWVFSLLMFILLTAIADSNQSQYSLQLTGGPGNPWAMPQVPENYHEFQHPSNYKNQQHKGNSENRQNQNRSSRNRMYQNNRFVTEEFLESLNRQQSQFQVMPDYGQYQFPSRSSATQQPKSRLPGPGATGYPSYGTGYVDPLVNTLSDVPVVTPWTPWDIGVSDW